MCKMINGLVKNYNVEYDGKINKNKNKNKRKGISLISLVVIIIIMLIITSVVMLTVLDVSPIEDANEAVIRSDIRTMQEKYELAYSEAYAKNLGEESKITNSDLMDVIPDKYKEDFKATTEGIVYIGDNETVGKIAAEMGILSSEYSVLENVIVGENTTSIDVEVIIASGETIDKFVYQIRQKGTTTWTEFESTNSTLTIENLIENTDYEVKVLAIQGETTHESEILSVTTKEEIDMNFGTLILKLNSASGNDYVQNTWASDKVYVAVTGKNTTYSVSGANTVSETSSATVLTNEGVSTLTFKTGSTTQEYIVKIDKTAAEIKSLASSVTAPTNTAVTLTGKAVDSVSGIWAYVFSTDDSLTAESTGWNEVALTTEEVEYTYSARENNKYYFYVKNGANLVTKQEITVDKIDSVSPTFDSLEVVSPVSGTYKVGQVVEIVARFSENITGTVPVLRIKFGTGIERTISNATIENNTIKYIYTIQDSDNGVLASTSYYGTLTDEAGNSVTVSNITLTGNSITADTKAPSLTSLNVTSPEAGIYKDGKVITFEATFSENIFGTQPELKIKFGEGTEKVVTAGEITGNKITYTYTILDGDNGEMVVTSYVGTVADSIGNSANIEERTVSVGTTIKTDTIPPTLNNVEITSNKDKTYVTGDKVEITITYSENLSGTVPPIKVQFGNGEEKIVTNGVIQGDKIIYDYTVEDGDSGELNITDCSGKVSDEAGNDIEEIPEINIGSSIIADTIPPVLNSISVISPATGTYGAGQEVAIVATYNEHVAGTVPVLKIKFGEGTERTINTGTINANNIVYKYTISNNDKGVLVLSDYVGSIADISGNLLTVVSMALSGNSITAYTEPIIKSFEENATTDFHAEEYRTKITKVNFANRINIPANVQYWDVSDAGNGSVVAYVEDDGNSGYILTIAGDGGVVANSNSSFLFYNFTALTEVSNANLFDTKNVTNFTSTFRRCISLTNIDVSNWDVSNVTDMKNMFRECVSLTELNVSNWDTSKVTTMYGMFASSQDYGVMNLTTLDVSNWDTGNVTEMAGMFQFCANFSTLNVSKWNTSKVTDMKLMFYACNALETLDVSNWSTGNVTSMNGMFAHCFNISDLDVSNWNVSKVQDMNAMFTWCKSLTVLNVSRWNTGNVTSVVGMFENCEKLETIDVSNWDVSKVTTFDCMFNDCHVIETIDVSNWNTESAIYLSQMFEYCYKLKNIDVSNFKTSKVKGFDEMFFKCYELTKLDLSSFDMSSVVSEVLEDGTILGLTRFVDECNKLQEVKIGDKVKFSTEDGISTWNLPTPNSEYIPGATGVWYNTIGEEFEPSEIPVGVADTYYAVNNNSTLYNITLHYNDNVTEDEVVQVRNASELPTPSREHYNFDAWYYGEEKNVEISDFVGYDEYGIPGYYGYTKNSEGIWINDNIGMAESYSVMLTQLTITENTTISFDWKLETDQIETTAAAGVMIDGDDYSYQKMIETLGEYEHVAINLEPGTYQFMFMMYIISPSINTEDIFSIKNISYGGLTLKEKVEGEITKAGDVFAIWNTIDYSITYNTNGGILSEDVITTYNVESNLSLPTPTKEGYDFHGWYENEDLSGESIYTSNGLYGDKVLYAKWTVTAYAAVYNGTDLVFGRGIAPETYNSLNLSEAWYGIEGKSYGLSETLSAPWITKYKNTITSAKVVDVISPFDTGYWFYNLTNCAIIDVSKLDVSNNIDMSFMFGYTGQSTTDFKIIGLNDWDTSNVTDMLGMFEYAGQNATTWDIGDLSNWNVSNVTSMNYMFQYAGENVTTWTVGDLSNWNVFNVTSMNNMFQYAGKNATTWNIGDLSKWNVSNVIDMHSMFNEAGKNATTWNIGDLSNWNVSNVKNMMSVFSSAGANATTWNIGDLSKWEVSNVTNMMAMFSSVAKNATTWTVGDLSKWNVSNVTNMMGMFQLAGQSAKTWNIGDLSNWDVSNVTDMRYMFSMAGYSATTFDISFISKWNVSSVTDMSGMFSMAGYSANTFDIGDLSKWNVLNVTNMNGMFQYAGKNATYTLDLSGWNVANVTAYTDFNKGVELKITPPNFVATTNNDENVEYTEPEVANITTTVNKDDSGNVIGVYMVVEEESGISCITILDANQNLVKEIALNKETSYSGLVDITDTGIYTVALVTSTGVTKQMTFEI